MYILINTDEDSFRMGNSPKELIQQFDEDNQNRSKEYFEDGYLTLYKLGEELEVTFDVVVTEKNVPKVKVPKVINK